MKSPQTNLGCLVLIAATTFGAYSLFKQYKICCLGNRRAYAANAMHAVWCPGAFELTLFCIYSPAHAIMWTMTTDTNLVLAMFVMVAISVQVRPFNEYINRI